MPSILIMSDSHGMTEEVMDIKQKYEGQVDGMIHCGDSELELSSEELQGFYYVKGNVDFDPGMEEEKSFTIEGITFFITHGHLFNIKSTLMPLNYRAEEAGADVVCFGHSHMAGAEKVDNRLFINPGSCRQPRDHREPTYALLSWTDKSDIKLKYYNMNHQPTELKFHTSLRSEG
ncbi:hypothetical protein SAMN05421743_105152 [Thalassobacillus cyri]|uniref:Phosphoesterase n=1 Tax=Thalassobacillus cyri TaxID=571932 RepID=A0A1H4BUS7_9BACI|nr:metallophosphoesterase [Thalassobacillus cyri]SEA51817.1 hypothetical protein SAMN05421743_105152 [Thalassobacillus cyri]